MKDLKQKNIEFFNKIAHNYDVNFFRNYYIKFLRSVINEVNIKKNSKILDIGCGTGIVLSILKNKNKKLKLYGIDISKNMLKISQKRLGKNVNLKLESIEETNFKTNYFDYIFSTEAFHHYYNHELAMKNIYNILKKNGEFILVDVNFGKILNKLFHIIEPGNTGMHTKREFVRLFEKHNFRIITKKREKLLFTKIISKK